MAKTATDLYTPGETIFVNIGRGIRFCYFDTPRESWNCALDIRHPMGLRNSDSGILLKLYTPLIYMGADVTRVALPIELGQYICTDEQYQPHIFMHTGKLLIKPIMIDSKTLLPAGHVRGLFCSADDL